MRRLADLSRRFARHRGGATAVEYGLLVALLAIVVVGAVRTTGVNLFNLMTNVSSRIQGGG